MTVLLKTCINTSTAATWSYITLSNWLENTF